MILPEEVMTVAKQKEDENLKFRRFLKNRADSEDLDKHFLRLHRELFANYDCTSCRNCCKYLSATIAEWDIPKMAHHLSISEEEFCTTFLKRGDCHEWASKTTPCSFLNTDGFCMLGNCRPEGCRTFPYTDKPERLESLLSVLNAVSVCPVAYEIWERLKDEYGFRRDR